MKHRPISRRRGFTLVELLTVIAIIGILAGVLVPAVSYAQTIARRMAAQNSVGQIAKSYAIFSRGGAKTRNIKVGTNPDKFEANSPALFAQILARAADLNDAGLWYIGTDDELAAVTLPRQVMAGTVNNLLTAKPVSWAVVCGASASAPDSTTPLLWTRGLGEDGRWITRSPWKGRGGHIAYLDGHVEWVESLVEAEGGTPLVVYQTLPNSGQPTANYREALNPGARAFEDTLEGEVAPDSVPTTTK